MGTYMYVCICVKYICMLHNTVSISLSVITMCTRALIYVYTLYMYIDLYTVRRNILSLQRQFFTLPYFQANLLFYHYYHLFFLLCQYK